MTQNAGNFRTIPTQLFSQWLCRSGQSYVGILVWKTAGGFHNYGRCKEIWNVESFLCITIRSIQKWHFILIFQRYEILYVHTDNTYFLAIVFSCPSVPLSQDKGRSKNLGQTPLSQDVPEQNTLKFFRNMTRFSI